MINNQNIDCNECFNPIQDGLFWACSRMRRGFFFPKIRHSYPTIMKLGSYTLPKEDPKNV